MSDDPREPQSATTEPQRSVGPGPSGVQQVSAGSPPPPRDAGDQAAAALPSPRLLQLLVDRDVARDVSASKELQDRQDKVLEQKKAVTERISESTRTLAFGVLASCFALLIAEPALAATFSAARPILLGSAALGISAIFADAAQYVFGYLNVQQTLASADQLYPPNWTRHWRVRCFLAKQALAYLSALLLLIAVVVVIF